jgi:hypothetical protein
MPYRAMAATAARVTALRAGPADAGFALVSAGPGRGVLEG